MRLVAGLTVAILGLVGCATMSESDCASADWRSIGIQDGQAGKPPGALGELSTTCGKFGFAPDMDQYMLGRQQGLRLFCQPSRGYDMGASGAAYSGVCAGDQEPAFLAEYNRGRELFRYVSAVNSARSALSSANNEIASLDGDIANVRSRISQNYSQPEDKRLPAGEIARLQDKATTLASRRASLVRSLPDLEARIRSAEIDLEAYKREAEIERRVNERVAATLATQGAARPNGN